jgi:hypothetical protein
MDFDPVVFGAIKSKNSFILPMDFELKEEIMSGVMSVSNLFLNSSSKMQRFTYSALSS